jgi:hypothetical protein
MNSQYGTTTDPVMTLVKQYDRVIESIETANKNWGSIDSNELIVNSQKIIHRLTQNKNPMNPQLDMIYIQLKNYLMNHLMEIGNLP